MNKADEFLKTLIKCKYLEHLSGTKVKFQQEIEKYLAQPKAKNLHKPLVMPSLPLDIIDFIGRCNLYREKGKWYNEDGSFANSDVSLLQYIVELNQKIDALGNEA